jgi:glutaminase
MKSPVQAYLEELHARFVDDRSGAVATYIPELGRADPELFGICLTTADGEIYEAGDTRSPFTIQSLSKPFTYGLALADRGREAVAAKIGVEPSGEAFNSIRLAPVTGRPLNPMINAGAIAATALVAGDGLDERFARILATYSGYAGRRLAVDESVYASERRTGHRNRAIGHLLRSFEIIDDDPDRALDLYFRQCSIAVDARDVSAMAAALANGGRQPVTGEAVLDPELVERVLSVMTTCGMYDGSGEWMDTVGLPAKSGVCGAIFAVLPGQLGLSVFSPRLDPHGNSTRGVAVCRALAEDLHLHSLHVARSARATIRATHDIGAAPSRCRRPDFQTDALGRASARAAVYELQGDVLFAGAERVVRAIVNRADELDLVLLDLRAVDRIEVPAARILDRVRAALVAEGKELAIVGGGLVVEADGDFGRGAPTFADLDEARQWCEDRLLAGLGLEVACAGPVALADHDLCRGMDEPTVTALAALLRERRYRRGDTIVAAGEPPVGILLVLAGEVGVHAGGRRLATLQAGTAFGAAAVLGGAGHTADVVAERDATIALLDAADFAELGTTDPRLKAQLLENMLALAYACLGHRSR